MPYRRACRNRAKQSSRYCAHPFPSLDWTRAIAAFLLIGRQRLFPNRSGSLLATISPQSAFGTWDAVEASLWSLRHNLFCLTNVVIGRSTVLGVNPLESPFSKAGHLCRSSLSPNKCMYFTETIILTQSLNHMYKHVKKSPQMSLDNLGTDYLDLLLLQCKWRLSSSARAYCVQT